MWRYKNESDVYGRGEAGRSEARDRWSPWSAGYPIFAIGAEARAAARPRRVRRGAHPAISGGCGPGAQLQALTAARPPVTVPVMRIEVHDNQVESALKTMKKLMLKDGLFKEMKKRAYYEKPSVKRKRKQAEARKKRRKAMKRAEADD